jgi:hypothetical protein
VGDFNGDLAPDLVAANYSGASVSVLLNTSAVATSFELSSPDTVVAGTPLQTTVTARNQFGGVFTSYTGTVHFTSTDPAANLSEDYTFTASDAGVHSFAGAATLYTAGNSEVTATDTVTGITGTANVNVVAAPAVVFQVIAPAGATSGTAFDVTVIAVDLYGNIDTNYTGTVNFTTSDTDPAVLLPVDYLFTAADQGTHTFSGGFTMITPGDQTLTAADLTGEFSASLTLAITL